MKLDKLPHLLQVTPGSKVSLSKHHSTKLKLPGLTKLEAKSLLQDGTALLAEYQDKLYAQNNYALLIILQAPDAAGKDGTIKHVMSGLNPQGCQVTSFKAPSSEELDHDYLWRCAKKLPERGNIGIFNRSYYEEVLIARVHPEILARQQLPKELIDDNIWKRRFEEINNFEKYLVNNGTLVVKFFLNISKEEQKRRFLERLDLPNKNWKFSLSDAKERTYWHDYVKAYEDCFNHTSTKWAPWYIIPADSKPFARIAVGYIIYDILRSLNPKYPKVSKAQKEVLLQAKAVLEQEK
jgi:PPK2 family polyphosphate:nucleotide phosphotransferase